MRGNEHRRRVGERVVEENRKRRRQIFLRDALADLRRMDRLLLARLIERRRFADARATILSPAGMESKAVHVIAS